MNNWTFTGRLGADAERHTTSGDDVLNFRVANDTGYGDAKKTQWVECSLWGARAANLERYMTKGTTVVVAGEVTLREFEKRDGSRGYSLSVRVSDVTLCGSPRDDDRGHR